MHFHVRYGNGESVFEVEPTISLRESHGLKVQELAKAENLAEAQRELIVRRWNPSPTWSHRDLPLRPELARSR